MERFGGIDIVCNNAGISDEDKWRKMLDINLVFEQGKVQNSTLCIVILLYRLLLLKGLSWV